MSGKIKRKIYFFKVEKSNCSYQEIVTELKSLNQDNLYSKDENKWFYIGKIDEKNHKIYGIFRNIRWDDFPQVGKLNQKDVTPLDLSKEEGLAEATHFILYPKSNILVLERNHYGPGYSMLEWHINEKIYELGQKNQREVKFNLIMNDDYRSKLDQIGEIYSVELEFPIAKAGELRELDENIFDALSNSASFGEVDLVKIEMKAKKWSKNPILENSRSLKDKIIKLFGSGSKRASLEKFKLKAFDRSKQKSSGFDLLEDKLLHEIEVVKMGRSKAINSKDIFMKLEGAYKNNSDVLKRYTKDVQ